MLTILFVCSGNTCRSPMAEAVLRHRLSEAAIGGVQVVSAGTAAAEGEPAALNAILAAASLGADLSRHLAQPLTRELVRRADLVLALGRSHHDAVIREVPEAADRTHLLTRFGPSADPEAPGVPDPFGGDLSEYTQTIHDLDAHIRRILPEIALRAAGAAPAAHPGAGSASREPGTPGT